MSAEAVYQSDCPVCSGKGNIEIFYRKEKRIETVRCEICKGSGKVMVVKKFRKGK